MPEFIEAQIVKGEVLDVECEVLSSINIPHLTLNIEPPAPLTACAALSIETRKSEIGNTTTRPSTLLGTGQSTLDTPASFGNRQSEIGNPVPLTACAAHSFENRLSTLLGAGHSTLDTRAPALPIANRKSEIGNIIVRPATMTDVPFIDRLQKKQSKQVGWFSTKTIEGKIALGHVLVAEVDSSELIVDRKDEAASPLSTTNYQPSTPVPAGYLIGNDRYHKRDELGCIFQINVDPAYRRHLVAARLLKAQFDRSAYGCRLYCCWCAQDIEANRFWESMGFVPLAFRAGSRKRDRVHIFWQKRIRAGDDGDPAKGGTPWWFPSLTGGGSLREDRIVLPIPPGVRWDQEMPRILPQSVESGESRVERALPGPRAACCVPREANRKSRSPLHGSRTTEHATLSSTPGRLRFSGAKATKPKAERRVIKFTPEQMAMSREVRDRWQEQVNAGMGEQLVALPMPKYDLTRGETRIETSSETTIPLLEAA